MSMQLFYGGFPHAADEARVTVDVQTLYDPSKLAFGRLIRWEITGTLIGNGAVNLLAQIQAMEAAYSVNYLDANLVDLSTGITMMSLTNAGSYTGVRVVRAPSYPRGDGPEFATERQYSISLEAEYDLPASPEIIDFEETVSFSGGGPIRTFVTLITGAPQPQILAEQTPYVCRQVGSAVGRRFKPAPPAPIFPGLLMKNPDISIKSAERHGLSLRNNRVTWAYEFQSPGPLLCNPNEWPLI